MPRRGLQFRQTRSMVTRYNGRYRYVQMTCHKCGYQRDWHAVSKTTKLVTHCTRNNAMYFAERDGWENIYRKGWFCPSCANQIRCSQAAHEQPPAGGAGGGDGDGR